MKNFLKPLGLIACALIAIFIFVDRPSEISFLSVPVSVIGGLVWACLDEIAKISSRIESCSNSLSMINNVDNNQIRRLLEMNVQENDRIKNELKEIRRLLQINLDKQS